MKFRPKSASLTLLSLVALHSTSCFALSELIGGDMKFHGTVVALPCSIAPGSETIGVDFKQTSIKDIYSNQKTRTTPFTVHLENCSTGVFNSVSVTLSGIEDTALPNHLAITSGGQGNASGVGIGLEETDGTAIKLNEATTPQKINANNMDLTYNAYLQGEPDAINQQTISYGTFSATATFTINYQ